VKSLHSGGGPGVEPRGLQYILHKTNRTNKRVTRGAHGLGHVSSYHLPPKDTCHFLIRQLPTNECFPRHFCTVVRSCHVRPYGLYGLVQSASKFLPVWLDEQIAISLAPDVRLRRNELRWVRNDEAYALVQFEVIPSTLNF
jgi:hypothetical protein